MIRNKRRLLRDLKKVMYTMVTVLGLILAFKIFSFSISEKSGDGIEYQRYFNENYKIFSLELPENLDFAGEKVPMKDLDVREKLDRELLVNTYWQSHSLLFHKRANRWFPVIEPILKDEGVPEDFKYLPLVESGFTHVVSPAGATGFWQFMEATAKEKGLEVNDEVDERYNIRKSTRAACDYLKRAYEKYGSWTLAAASYNVGMGRLDEQLEKQRVDTYYELLLNEETSRYVYRILAVKEILSNSKKYGFHIREQDLYPPYKTKIIEVDSTIDDLADFALKKGINYKVLKILNPWLRENELTNPQGKTYRIRLPKPGSQKLIHPDTGLFENDSLEEMIEEDSLTSDSVPPSPKEKTDKEK